MLKMKTACEKCAARLAADGSARICSFECTFCEACSTGMAHACPNCNGELVPRPRRVRSVASVAAAQAGATLKRWLG